MSQATSPQPSTPPTTPPRRKGGFLASTGGVLTLLGAIPTVIAFVLSASPNAGWSIFLVLGLMGIGIPLLFVGGVLLLLGTIRRRRSVLAAPGSIGTPHEHLGVAIAGLVLAWFPLAGLPLSLYGFYGNPANSRARRVALVGVLANLALAAVFILFGS